MLNAFLCSGSSPGQSDRPDFFLECHGSIYLLRPTTPSAFDWISENLPSDALRFGDAVVIEWRYVSPILIGLQSDGLAVSHD